ncbi:MAG: DNA replication/repair protein RecF [Ruminococcus sp.]|nr:DNA replication/repair protein RecF [Ruminococcus sp.]
MIIKKLRFENFRNLSTDEIIPCEKVNVIYGDNAQGKTNLLEAIWLFCGGHSFRGAKENELINFNDNFFKLTMDFYSQDREQNAEISFSQNKKKIKLNGVEKSSSSYLTEVFSCVVFSPENMTLVKRGPSLRRKFLDGAICQQRIRYAAALAKYNQIINQRNALLKDIYKHKELKETLPIWDDSLAVTGAIILRERLDYIKNLKVYAQKFHDDISCSKEVLNIEYVSNCDVNEDDSIEIITEKLREAYKNSRHDDYHTGYTNIGPHRDDMEIKINDISAKTFGSQGQQRSAVLSLKLAQAQMLFEKNLEKPVILLDDVLSELDSKRQDFLLNKVEGYQVFVTCCEESNKEQLKNGKIFYINSGEVK